MSSEVIKSRRVLNLRFEIPVSRTKEFWDGLKRGKLLATKCKACGHLSFPPQVDCPVCMKTDPEWVELSKKAKLLTYTQVQVTPASFVDHDPYIVAIAELREGPKILAWIENSDIEKLFPGMELEIETRISKEGNPYYVFRPV